MTEVGRKLIVASQLGHQRHRSLTADDAVRVSKTVSMRRPTIRGAVLRGLAAHWSANTTAGEHTTRQIVSRALKQQLLVIITLAACSPCSLVDRRSPARSIVRRPTALSLIYTRCAADLLTASVTYGILQRQARVMPAGARALLISTCRLNNQQFTDRQRHHTGQSQVYRPKKCMFLDVV